MASNQLILLALTAALFAQQALCKSTAEWSESEDVALARLQQTADAAAGANKAQLEKQSIWPNFLWPQRAREEPDFFLVWLKLYEPFIPKQIQEMIHQQVSPMTEQISAQIIQSVPGSEQFYQQLQQFFNLFQNFIPTSLTGGGRGNSGSFISSLAGRQS